MTSEMVWHGAEILPGVKPHKGCNFKKYMLFFITNAFFASVLLKFSINYIEAMSYRDTLYFVYLPLCLYLGLYISYLCDLFCHYHYHYHFHYN